SWWRMKVRSQGFESTLALPGVLAVSLSSRVLLTTARSCGGRGVGSEEGGALEVEHVEERVGVGVAPRHRGQVEQELDEARDRRVLVHDVRDMVRARVRRDDDQR